MFSYLYPRLRKSRVFALPFVDALLLVVCYCYVADAEGVPPSITIGPLREKIYKVNHEVTLDCELHGVPYPEFHWRKDGVVVNPTNNVVILGNGGIRFLSLTAHNEGYYQCYASNVYGTVMSDVIALRRAIIHRNTATDVEEHDLIEGRPFMLPCRQVKSYPRPQYSWIVVSKSGSHEAVTQDSRIQIDEHGNLHFAYIEGSDSRDESTYKCVASNTWLNEQSIGSSAKLRVSGVQRKESNAAPRYGFSSPETVIGLLGSSVTLRCFFYGRPIPEIRWYHKNGLPLPPRFLLSNHNTELLINNLTFDDEGVYECNASSGIISILHKTTVKVDAVPTFQSQPSSFNATEDGSVSFNCRTDSKPKATVTWSRNGLRITAGTLPPRYSLNNDGTVLTISKLCRKCPDGSSDSQVIQCNASNQHGYVFGAGYVNVISMLSMDHSEPCNSQDYCLNGGRCFVLQTLGHRYCQCLKSFRGERCQEKLPFDMGESRTPEQEIQLKLIVVFVVCGIIAIELIIIIIMLIIYFVNKKRNSKEYRQY